MSNPVSNVEIEDVLSSIRRLVSDEARPSPRSEEPQPVEVLDAADDVNAILTDHLDTDASLSSLTEQDEGEQQSSNVSESLNIAHEQVVEKRQIFEDNTVTALVLTPSFRVNETEAEAEKDSENNAPESVDAVGDADASEAEVDELLILSNDLQDQESEQSSAWVEDETAEETPEAAPLEDKSNAHSEPMEIPSFLHRASLVDENANDLSHSEADHVSEADDGQTSHEQSDPHRSIEAKIAELETLISRTNDDFEPDGDGEVPDDSPLGTSLPWRDSDEPRRVDTRMDEPDPDAASDEADFDPGAAAFQHAHREATEAVEAEIQSSVADALSDTAEPGVVLDEDTLRDMVADIVRQELQGPLGERITRNVRKLVRREIYRALAANELD